MGGSFARSGIPQAINSTAYNAANHQTTFGDKTLTYDNNGNLQTIADGSGTTTYTWNARNQLVSVSGPGVSATFVYDGLGRREKKTINGSLTEFLFDGVDSVQETSGATILANMLSGAGVDEIITRTDAGTGATSTFLTDALGSPVALANASGIVQTEYTYEPFGKTTFTGSSNSSSYQYTGRENDGTGLYYYRARYYHPVLQRFISEDPIEFDGGDTNLYSYVWNNPVSYTDPSGEFPWAAVAGACAMGAATGVGAEFGFGWISGRKPTPSAIGSAALSGCAGGLVGLGLGKFIDKALGAAKTGAGAADDVGKWVWGQNKGVAKSIRQMEQRGWSPQQVTEAIKGGQQIPAQNMVNPGNPAIRYVHPQTGQSVVQDTVTTEIIHFGGPGFKY